MVRVSGLLNTQPHPKQSPQSDGSRRLGKNSPQSDGSGTVLVCAVEESRVTSKRVLNGVVPIVVSQACR